MDNAERSEPAELGRLLARTEKLSALVDEIDTQQREAHGAVHRASADVVQLERRALAGEPVADKDRARVERSLSAARASAAAPWAERREAAKQAARDARQEAARYAREHLAGLTDVLQAEGEDAAAAIDAACAALVAAYTRRQEIEGRMFALLAMVGRTSPNDVTRSRCDQLVVEVRRFLGNGGECPPAVVRRPDEPQHPLKAVPAA